MPKFAVIIPAYNAAHFLPATIASVQAQENADWEIVVVDDGSTDHSSDLVAGIAAGDPRVRCVHQENAGVSAARNLGARHVDPTTRYLWFLDSDDLLAPDALRRTGEYLDEHPEVGLVACQFQLVREDGTPAGAEKRSRWGPGGWCNLPRQLGDEERRTPFEAFYCGTGQGPFALYRRDVFTRTEGWEPRLRYHEDTDMFCQMALLAEVHCLPERLYIKRIHAGQSTDLSQGESAQRLWDSYAIFREKWDQRRGRDEAEQRKLEAARCFYRGRFQPARDLKLVRQIWRDQLRGKWSRPSILYSFTLTRNALRALWKGA